MDRELLLNAFFSGNSVTALCETVGESIGCPLLIVDNAFAVLSFFAPRGYLNEEYHRAIAHSELPLSLCRTIALCAAGGGSRIPVADGARRFFVSALASGGVSLGFLLYLCDDACALPEKEDCLYAEQLLAKQLYAQRGGADGAHDTAQAILCELLQGGFASEELFARRIEGTYLAHFAPSGFALLAFSEQSRPGGDPSHFLQSLARSFPASHPFFYEGDILLFLQHDSDLSLLRRAAEQYKLQIVLFLELDSLFALEKSARLCRDVLRQQRALHPGGFFIDSAEYALCAQLAALEECYGYLSPAVHALWQSDRENKTQLCLTLYTYYCNHHSLKETADALFTHRNTVQYRLRRIREEFGMDTDAPQHCLCDLLSLSLALERLAAQTSGKKAD